MRRVAPLLLAASLAAPSLAVGPAAAQELSAANPAGLADALQDLGYRASLETDSEGDPLIRSSMEGMNYRIVFYGCEEHRDCKYLQLSAGFDLDNGTTMDVINDWNRSKIAGSAYLDDENDPYLKYFLTTVGGLSQQTFEDTIDWWRVAISDFKVHIGF